MRPFRFSRRRVAVSPCHLFVPPPPERCRLRVRALLLLPTSLCPEGPRIPAPSAALVAVARPCQLRSPRSPRSEPRALPSVLVSVP